MPQETLLPSGTAIYRAFNNTRTADEFNPGTGTTRFAFFGKPTVPILYGAQEMESAICESILHDIPQDGGRLIPAGCSTKVGARLTTTRPLRLATFMGLGLKVLKIENTQLIDTPPVEYAQTVKWAAAAHRAGFDGVVYISRRCNTHKAYALFGDRVLRGDLAVDPGYGRIFAAGSDLEWLINFCAPIHIEVLIHS